MARLRTLKPQFFKDLDLAEKSFPARLFFAGLWCQADRAGRLRDEPRLLKAELFPYDDVDAEALLAELAAPRKNKPGLILRYEIGGERFIAIPHFLDHQKPYHKEAESRIPPHPSYVTGQPGAKPEPDTVQTALSLVVPSSVIGSLGSGEDPPIPPASGGRQANVLRLKKRERPGRTLQDDVVAERDRRRDARSRNLFAWLEKQSKPAWDETLGQAIERGPPSREAQLLWVQENCHASPEEAEDAVALVEAARQSSHVPGVRNGH